jgi:hypothetical protein
MAIATAATDDLAPTVVISSPLQGQAYSGTMTFAGTVSDDATVAGDKAGTLASISYSVANNELLKGKIKIDSSGNASQDTAYGAGTITWNNSTKAYSFAIDTTTLTSNLTVYITAADVKGNAATATMSLAESNGPVITITQPTATKFTKGTIVDLVGTIGNSKDDTSSASNIKSISWQIATMGWSGTLTVGGATADVHAPNVGFTPTRTYDFIYSPSTRTFSTQFYINSGATSLLPIEVTATDYNGHTSKTDMNLYEDAAGPQLELTLPSNDYYTTGGSFTGLDMSGTITDWDKVSYVTYQVQSVATPSLVTAPVFLYGGTAPAMTGASFTFHINRSDASAVWAAGGSVNINVTAANSKNESVETITMYEDSTGPVISPISMTSNNTTS